MNTVDVLWATVLCLTMTLSLCDIQMTDWINAHINLEE